MQKIKKFLKEVLKEHWLPATVLGVLNIFLYLYMIKCEDPAHKNIAIISLFVFILLEFSFLAFYHFLKTKRKYPLEKIFLFLAIPLGLLQIFITPFNQLPDELAHIFRVTDIANGHVVSTKNEEGHYRSKNSKTLWQVLNNGQGDSNYYKRIKNNILAPTSDEEWGWDFDTAATYSPVAYAPQVAGVTTGKVLHLPIVLTFYLGRIFTLIAFVVVVYFAIKLTPKFKEFFVLFALLPMTLQQGMAFSADSVLTAFSFLLIALAIKYAYGNDKKLSKKQISALYIVTAIVSCAKHMAYLPLGLLFLLIPAKKFKSTKHKYIHLVLIVALCFGLAQLWNAVQDKTVVATVAETATSAEETTPGYSFIKFIIVTFGMLFGIRPDYYAEGIVGTTIGYNSYTIQAVIYNYLFVGLVTVMILRSTEKIAMRKYDKLIFWLTPIILSIVFYYAATYNWGFRSDASVAGIQGRYFIPFLTLIPFMAYRDKKDKDVTPLKTDYVFYFVIFANCCVLAAKMLHNL